MNIIVKYVGLSIKKNFAYRVNGFLVIFDTLMDCLAVWLFWMSLMELDLNLIGWDNHALKVFMGFSLISSAVSNLFIGSWDIEDHILSGTLENYLVKPCNSILLILLERANFLRFVVTFPIGIGFVAAYAGFSVNMLLGLVLCIISSVLIELILLASYELAFWLKKVDSYADIIYTVCSISRYPLIFFGKKLLLFFTYVIPVAFVGTIPTELITGETTIWFWPAFLGLTVFIIGSDYTLWKWGRKKNESTN